jgi:hypothetical protein
MFGFKKKGGPNQAFTHAPDCKILKADPDVEIPWQEIEANYWVAECQCGKEYWREPPADRRVRRDPYDPSTFRHEAVCEHRDVTDPSLLRTILKVTDGLDPGYWWVECLDCRCAWQVMHYAAESVG